MGAPAFGYAHAVREANGQGQGRGMGYGRRRGPGGPEWDQQRLSTAATIGRSSADAAAIGSDQPWHFRGARPAVCRRVPRCRADRSAGENARRRQPGLGLFRLRRRAARHELSRDQRRRRSDRVLRRWPGAFHCRRGRGVARSRSRAAQGEYGRQIRAVSPAVDIGHSGHRRARLRHRQSARADQHA